MDYRVTVNKSVMVGNELEKEIWGEKFISIVDLLIDENTSVKLFTPDFKFINFDTDQITPSGAKYLGKLLLNETRLNEYFNKK